MIHADPLPPVSTDPAPAPAARHPSLRECLVAFARMGVLSFGGPAAQIGILHRILVDEKKWISDRRFQHALSFCMLLPGPEATQLATYVGWLLHGVRGGLLAAALFILPGALIMLGLSIAYVRYGDLAPAAGVLLGLKSATIAIVLASLHRLTRRTIRTPLALGLAAAVMLANGVFGVGFPVLIAVGALLGPLLGRRITGPAVNEPLSSASVLLADDATGAGRTSWVRSAMIAAVGVVLWLAPVALAYLLLGKDHVLTGLGTVFSKAALVTFGGAYAVLGYFREQFVDVHHWLTAQDMVSGLALAEAKPGPLILVGQFLAFVSANGQAGSRPLLAGVAASAMFLWTSFVPCLLWIFVFGPYVELARGKARLASMLAGISAIVVGVIATLTVWLIVHTVFQELRTASVGGITLRVPEPASVRWSVVALATAAGALLWRTKLGIGWVLVISVVAGLAWTLLRPSAPATP